MTVHMTQRQRRRKLWKRGTQKPTPKKETDFLAGIAFKFQGVAVLRAQAEHGKPQPPPPDRQSRVFYYGVAKGHEEDIQHCRRQAGPLVIVGTSRAPLTFLVVRLHYFVPARRKVINRARKRRLPKETVALNICPFRTIRHCAKFVSLGCVEASPSPPFLCGRRGSRPRGEEAGEEMGEERSRMPPKKDPPPAPLSRGGGGGGGGGLIHRVEAARRKERRRGSARSKATKPLTCLANHPIPPAALPFPACLLLRRIAPLPPARHFHFRDILVHFQSVESKHHNHPNVPTRRHIPTSKMTRLLLVLVSVLALVHGTKKKRTGKFYHNIATWLGDLSERGGKEKGSAII